MLSVLWTAGRIEHLIYVRESKIIDKPEKGEKKLVYLFM